MTCTSASRTFLLRVLCALSLLPFFLLPCNAQTTLGSIFGTITDSSGAVIPNATITVTSLERGTTRTTKTTSSGAYRVTELEPGTYRIAVEHQGFARTQSKAIPLAIEATVRADMSMKLGSNSVTVEVDASNPLLETGSAEISSQITAEELKNLPDLNRNIVSLMSIGVGVTGGNYDPSAPTSGDRVGQITGAEVVAMGTPPYGNSFILDGVATNMEFSGTIATRPPMDMAAGFQTQIAQYPADEGRAAGAILNMSLKSGTNQFHGSVYGYVQNSYANAKPKNYFTILPYTSSHRYQYGTNLGGPIIKDRLFFFTGFEGLRQGQATAVNYVVPAMSEKVPVSQYAQYNIVPTDPTVNSSSCDGYYFGATTDGGGNKFAGITEYNPTVLANGAPAPWGNTAARQPFQNNCIPASYINPLTAKLLSYYPNSNDGPKTYVQSSPRTQSGDWETEKTNWTLTPQDSIDLHFLRQNQYVSNTGLNPAISTDTLAQNGINAGVNYFRVITTAMVNVARVSYTRFYLGEFPPNQTNFVGSQIPGWPAGAAADGYPSIAPDEISGMTPSQLVNAFAVPFRLKENNYQVQDMLTWQHGRHSVKFGGEYEQVRAWERRDTLTGGGDLTFAGTSTTATTSSSPTDGVADMLLGLSSKVSADYPLTANGIGMRTNYIMPFVQDDWRLTRSLTINLGLRYDIFTPYHVDNDRTWNFDPTTGTVLIPSDATFARVNLGFTNGLPAHWAYLPRNLVYKRTYWKSIDPRIGFAQQINRKLVWRGGFGLYHVPQVGNFAMNGAANSVGVAPSISNGAPLCLSNQLNWCPSSSVGLPSDPTGGFKATVTSPSFVPYYLPRNLPDPYSLKITLDFEYSPIHNIAFDIGYMNAQSEHFWDQYNINQAPLTSSDTINDPVAARQPYPYFGGINAYSQANHTKYNAGFVAARFQKWHGLQFNSYYTYSKTLGYGDSVLVTQYIPRYDYGRTDSDIRNRWVSTFIYRIPKPSWRFVGTIVGHWDMSGVINMQSGMPFTVSDSGGTALNVGGTGGTGQRPYMLHNPNLPPNKRTLHNWLDHTAFAHIFWCTGGTANVSEYTSTAIPVGSAGDPCPGLAIPANSYLVSTTQPTMPPPWGNEGKNIIGGPPEKVFSTAIQRRFLMRKGYMTLRLEEYNLFNHPNYNNPSGTNFNVPSTTGEITGSRTGPRQLTATLRYDF